MLETGTAGVSPDVESVHKLYTSFAHIFHAGKLPTQWKAYILCYILNNVVSFEYNPHPVTFAAFS